MNNSGPSFLMVPGFGGLPINYELDPAECFNDGTTGWRQFPRLTARELAMITLMDLITDTDNWEVDIFDEKKVASWREEASAAALTITFEEKLDKGWGEKRVSVMPLISDKAWSWCVLELRDKAALSQDKGYIRTVDAGSCVCKSDIIISTTLTEEFKHAVAILQKEYRDQNGHDSQIADLVDPSMFPLIYGKTLVNSDGRQVGLENCVESCNNLSTTIATLDSEEKSILRQRDDIQEEHVHPSEGLHAAKPLGWSLHYQWLPCEIRFSLGSGAGVSIISYINNLHPLHHKPLYGIIEKITASAVELWNGCIFKGKTGPVPVRIRTYGYEPGQPPEWLDNIFLTMRSFWEKGDPQKGCNFEHYEEFLLQIDNFLDFPNNQNDDGINWISEKLKQKIADRDRDLGRKSDGYERLCSLVSMKKACVYGAAHPEPGSAYSYEDWKAGKNGKAIIGPIDIEHGQKVPSPMPDVDDGIYKIALQDEFKTQGLQVIVRFRDIELTPAQATFASDFTFEAQRNEHIVATAAYIYSNENTNAAKISFRQAAWMHEYDYDFKEDSCEDPETIFASMRAVFAFAQSAAAEQKALDAHDGRCFIPGLQTVGSIFLPSGRLLTWPNTLQHRLEPLQLLDCQRPGHLRTLLLYLVDPNYRIASTANVPPQQHEWWSDVVLEKSVFSGPVAENMPTEIRQMIDKATEEWPMGRTEAIQVKGEVERERAQSLAEANENIPCYIYDPEHWE